MAQVTIHKCKDQETMPRTLAEQARSVMDNIRQRAYELFQGRNSGNGSDLDDWVRAEQEVVLSPVSELMEDTRAFRARIALPGFNAQEIQLTALPDALVVQGEATHTHDGHNGDVRFCEFLGKKVFRRFDLPSTVDVDKVSASMDNGILEVTAPKASTKTLTASA